MDVQNVWNKEYADPQLLALGDEPQKDVKRFLKWLKKEYGWRPAGKRVLDLGSGTGRNANYLAELGAKVTGIEIAENAIMIAKERVQKIGVDVTYLQQNMGDEYPLEDASLDLVIDITSSNSLNEKEREVYLGEVARALKPGGFFFVKTLAKEGDTNAKKLLKQHPGREHDTYIMPGLGLAERVFSREDFVDLYSPYFTILKMERKTSYTRFGGQSYKRNFWLVYMQK